jgi:hypothetical protein
MPVVDPLLAHVHPQNKIIRTILHGLSIPDLSEFSSFGKYICRLGIVAFNLPSN